MLLNANIDYKTNIKEKRRLFYKLLEKDFILKFTSPAWSYVIQKDPDLIICQQVAKCSDDEVPWNIKQVNSNKCKIGYK